MKLLLLLFSIIQLVFPYKIEGRKCGHSQIVNEFESSGRRSRRANSLNTRSTAWEDIRVHVDYSNVENDSGLSEAKKTYLKEYIGPKAKASVEKLLMTKSIEGNLLMTRPSVWCADEQTGINGTYCRESNTKTCFQDIVYNREHFTEKQICQTENDCVTEGGGAEDSDFIIYLGAFNINPCDDSSEDGTIAFASACEYDDNDNQPLAGYANCCPHLIDTDLVDDYNLDKYVRVVVHEIFHALGFTQSIFMSRLGLPSSANFKERTSGNDNNVWKLTTENAISAAAEHFNCPTINGLELENQGGSSTALSHPEERIFYGDFMNGVMPAHPLYSNISLSIMRDLGWYYPIYENMEQLWFGKGAGCDFALEKCIGGTKDEPVINGPDFHFCTENTELLGALPNLHCTADRRAIGACALASATVSDDYQYLDGLVGPLEVADYCPMYLSTEIQDLFSELLSEDYTGDCYDVNNNPQGEKTTMHGEIYQPGSRCFMSSLQNSFVTEEILTLRGRCHNYTCLFYDKPGEDYDGYLKGVSIFLKGYLYDRTVDCYVGEDGKNKAAGGTWVGVLKCPSDDHLLMLCPSDSDGIGSILGPNFTDDLSWIEQYWFVVLVAGVAVFLLFLLLILCFFALCGCKCKSKKKYRGKQKRGKK